MDATTRARPRRKTRGILTAEGDPAYEFIPLDRIEPDPALPPRAIDETKLARLARSLERRGQLVPITVRRVVGRDKFLIISGERRWRAAYQTTRVWALWCQVVDDPDEGEVLIRRLTEDLARDDFPLLELGEMIAKVQALRGWSTRKMAREFCVSVGRVRRPLALLRLPHQIQGMVRRGELPPSHAIEIEKAPVGDQLLIAEEVVKEGLRLEETEDMVSDYRTKAGDPPQGRWRRAKFSWPGVCDVVINPRADRSAIFKALHSMLRLLDDV